MKKILGAALSLSLLQYAIQPASANVVVQPKEVRVAEIQMFRVEVSVEKNIHTTSLRLVLPEGLEQVTPNSKAGWTVEIKRGDRPTSTAIQGTDHNEGTISEIIWSGGTIPPGRGDEFLFSAQVPAQETALAWKAYQTYVDGSMVSWDQDPTGEQQKNSQGEADFSKAGPYSETYVVGDGDSDVLGVSSGVDTSVVFSGTALVISLISLGLQLTRRK